MWKLELGDDDKPTKVLYTPTTGRRAKSNDSSTFRTRLQAEQAFASGGYSGLGFLVHEDLNITVVDVDDITDEAAALQMVADTNTYAEWSPNRGIHLIFADTPGNRIHTAAPDICRKAEQYSRLRWMTFTGDRVAGTPEMFSDDVPTLTAVLDRLSFAKRVTEQPRPTTEWTGDGLTNDQILKKAFRARNGEKIRRLYDGDTGDYPSASEADLALTSLLGFYTPHDDQLADLLRSSGVYRKKHDRDDYIQRTIKKARSGNALYDPNHYDRGKSTGVGTASETVGDEAADRETLKAEIRRLTTGLEQATKTIEIREEVIARERAIRKEAETQLERVREQKSKAMQVLRNPDLSLGERVTGFALALDLGARLANGEMPTTYGFNVPAVRYAEMTGQSEQTVARHMRELSITEGGAKKPGKGLFRKHVVREPLYDVNQETGEKVEAGSRDRNYIDLEDATIIDLTERLASYQRPDGETKHGGHRKPTCDQHPDAGTIKKWHIECAECHKLLDSGKTYQAPGENPEDESSDINLIPEVSVANTLLRGDRLIPEPTLIRPDTILISEDPPKPKTCWECHGPLEDGQTALCRSCSAASKRRAEQAERVRHAGTLRCVQCGDPTPSRQDSYCHRHGGRSAAGMVAS